MKKNIVLCGFMGSGKSTIGKKLARILETTLYDSDKTIVEVVGKSVSDIFAQDGEQFFRQQECSAIDRLSRMEGIIIATGGGVMMNKENVEKLRHTGIVFYLNPSLGRLAKNLLSDTSRPLLEGGNKMQTIKRLRKKRDPIYRGACDVEIQEDKMRKTIEIILAEYAKQT